MRQIKRGRLLGRRSFVAIVVGMTAMTGCSGAGPLAPSDPGAQFSKQTTQRMLSLGTRYEEIGRPDAARRIYAAILSGNPDDPAARERLAMLDEKEILQTQQLAQQSKSATSRGRSKAASAEAAAELDFDEPAEFEMATEMPIYPPLPTVDSQKPVKAPAATSVPDDSQIEQVSDAWWEQEVPGVVAVRSESSAATSPVQTAALVSKVDDEEAVLPLFPDLTSSPGPAGGEPTAPPVTRAQLLAACRSTDPAVRKVVGRLAASKTSARIDAIEELRQMTPHAKSIAPSLRLLLHDGTPAVRLSAATALWKLTGEVEAPVAALTQCLRDGNPVELQMACLTLGEISGTASPATLELEQLLFRDDSASRLCAAEALLRIDAEHAGALGILLQAAQSDNPRDRAVAAAALAYASPSQSDALLPELVRLLNDQDDEVRIAAAVSLGQYPVHAPMVLEALKQATLAPNRDLADMAKCSLQIHRDSAAQSDAAW